ncbi:hypothetical protein RCH12_000378 [Cryobacterium sp. MP_3.1]|uniref:hypothetical protein n=1 Tax=Cryobacterium sp. MP_3.1 TaxID=3071711 RepID=UPI002DFBC66E|nr:hypothetical protein [Cryobacterium sp. MP_3.1]
MTVSGGTGLPDPDDDSLVNPAGLYVLRARAVPGGRVEVGGFATFQTVRVRVDGVSSQGQIKIFGDLPPHGVYGRHDDPQVNGVFGRVDFGWLSRFWLTRTSTFDTIDETTPRPGVLAQVDGLEVGLADTCGTVSLAGVPQLQLIWLGAGEPAGDGWAPDGYGAFTKLVDRRLVSVVRHVEWTAIWRDLTVQVATIRNGRAVIFAPKGGLPPFDAPEIARAENIHSGWSAVVPFEQLSLRSWTSTERPLGAGVVANCVGLVRGRYALVARPAGPSGPGEDPVPAPGSEIVVKKGRGQTVTADFVLLPYSRYGRAWDWRVTVDESEVSDLRQVTATTTWQGQTYAVEGGDDSGALVYLNGTSVDVNETTPFVYTAQPADRRGLPVDSIFW